MSSSEPLTSLLNQIKDPESRAWVTYIARRLDTQDQLLSDIMRKPALRLEAREVSWLQDFVMRGDRRESAQVQSAASVDATTRQDKARRWFDLLKIGLTVTGGGLAGILASHFRP